MNTHEEKKACIKVSIIMPCYNEEKFLGRAIESLTDDFVRDFGEILVVDGHSTDNTVFVAESYRVRQFPVKVLHNDKRLQCYGLNMAIEQAAGDIIIRVDGHSTYPPCYVQKLLTLLKRTGAANVGGIMLPIGETAIQQSVAWAMQHPVGVGNAKFHLGNFQGYVDTVYLGAFHKEDLLAVGLFDTNCQTNEDAELNIRLLKAGKKIYLDSNIEVCYLPRDSFGKLAKQYFRYGMGRAYTTIKHKLFTSYRQAAPPILVLGLALALAWSILNPWALLLWLFYFLALQTAAFFTWRKKKIPSSIRFYMGLAFLVMHLSWGCGFIGYFIKKLWPHQTLNEKIDNNGNKK